MKNFSISRMDQSEINFALTMARHEGWNPGLYDAIPYFHTDPNGFFIGKTGHLPIACGSAVIYNKKEAFFGLHIVKEKLPWLLLREKINEGTP